MLGELTLGEIKLLAIVFVIVVVAPKVGGWGRWLGERISGRSE